VKTQEFVEFGVLASIHGVVVQPRADDLTATLAQDKVDLGRPSGLTLSESPELGRRISITRSVTFDQQLWNFDREAKFADRQVELTTGAADAPPAKRSASRLDLARFYLSRDMFVEAKAVLDVAIRDDRPSTENPTALVLRSFANIMLDRAEAALKDLANPLVGNQHDAQLWRALAYVRQGKWTDAREHFREVGGALRTLPVELQRVALRDRLRAAIEVGDLAGASATLNDLETVGVPPDLTADVAVLAGRVAERLGRSGEAIAAYRSAAASADRPAAARGRLREIVLRHALGEANKAQLVEDLEILTIAWRGDETEIEALQLLARLYTDEQRFRDAFQIMRTALVVHPSSALTRRIHEDAAATFDQLFLVGKGDTLPAIESLSLFYDFRDLTPVGRRGDEMIRRLADRLVAVDLLDPAAELLQYQVDNRLQGVARAQVATRLAAIYLLNHKPAQAQAALRATRTGTLSTEMRNQRLMVEARALSDIGKYDLALEVIANIEGDEAVRLRADIHWAARRWQQAAEQIELGLGDRWQNFDPLTDRERADILRAGIGYALADDAIGRGRLRERYGAKMSDGPDKHAFDVVMGGLDTNSAEFRDVARLVASVDTLDGFLRDLQARYPEMSVLPVNIPGQPALGSPAPPPKPDRDSTGSIARRSALRPVPSRPVLR
jgi:tetratricopeptide (TPR) repeat protein